MKTKKQKPKNTTVALPKTAAPKMRKVTMMLPADLVETAPDYLKKKNFTETVRFALKDVLHRQACRELLAMRGKINFGMTWQELKELRD